ncbi:MAG: transglycosylase SLT domain-containing protein [Treponema sp.]|nr:transglycosylase SLT domain-containing protein [Treponema sp.]
MFFICAPVYTQTEIKRPLRTVNQNEQKQSAGSRNAAALTALSIPGIDKELTLHYIQQYSSPGGIAWLNAVIRRGSPYIPFIREEVRRRNLPEELIYLPVIESGFLSTAVSKSGAAGLWQFMKNSMGPFDMKVTTWVDERMDFWKSTGGALRKLEENYTYFGDWPLALAAYNYGLGGVNRVIKNTGIKDYWELCNRKELRTETIHYVPKLLAVSYILSNPRRFGVDLWPEDPQWTRVPVGVSVDLDLLAAEAGVEAEALRISNRELRYNVTPPDGNYHLKVSAEAAPRIQAALEQKDRKLIKNYVYTIRSGDTLSALSFHYGVSAELIRNANPGIRPQFLKIGEQILIPALKEVAPYQKAPGEKSAFEGTHLVQKGETLWALALLYNVDPEVLAEANGMGLNDTLREGRTLKTPIRQGGVNSE